NMTGSSGITMRRSRRVSLLAWTGAGGLRSKPIARVSGRLRQLSDLDLPSLRSLLQIGPGKLLRIFRFELIIERLGIVIVDEDERRSGPQIIHKLKDFGVSLCGHQAAHIDYFRSTLGHLFTPAAARLSHMT